MADVLVESVRQLNLNDLPKRPPPCTLGKEVQVRANAFYISSFKTSNVHQYDVVITPDVPPAVTRLIFVAFEAQNRDRLKNARVIYDGRKIMYSPVELPFGNEAVFDVSLSDGDSAPNKKQRAPRSFKVLVRKANVLNMEELNNFINGKVSFTENCMSCLMALNVLFGYGPSLDHVSKGRSFYIPPNGPNAFISGGLEVWNGFFQSVKPAAGRLILNVDVANTAFYSGGPLDEFLVRALDARSINDLRRGIPDRDRRLLDRRLKNVKVRVTHRGDMKRKYRIAKLTPGSAQNTKFKLESGQVISVADYFAKQYNMVLNHPFLPCVEVQRGCFLPVEVCEIVPGQRYVSKLSSNETSDMIRRTCRKPHERLNLINDGISMLGFNDSEYLEAFGIQVNPELARINARILPSPTVCYGSKSREAQFAPRDGKWDLRDKSFVRGQTLVSWSVLVVSSRLRPQEVQAFVAELCNMCQKSGMNIQNRQPPLIPYDNRASMKDNLKQAFQAAGDAAQKMPQLILVILPDASSGRYGEIKTICETELGIPTQCVQGKHVGRPKPQYCANVAMKINVKLQGVNHHVSPRQMTFVDREPTIVIGADVSHPRISDKTRPSVVSLVGSMDPNCATYAATLGFQEDHTGPITEMGNLVCDLLRNFYRRTKCKPTQIILYRNGLSDGQFRNVRQHEISSMKRAIVAMDKAYNPRITYIALQKRHHVRLFPLSQQAADRSGNCLPGTVVDKDITHSNEFDFYLQSHAGLQGTSRPTHYHVLHDDNRMSSNDLQQLTYNLCYLFARSTSSVSYVAPCYYASLLCTRTRLYAGEDGSDYGSVLSEDDNSDKRNHALTPKPALKEVMYYM
jgi:eukaryotic translation initiation factor 2C